MEYEVEGPRPRGRPKRTWREVVREDCQARKLNKEDAMDRCKWRKMIKDIRWSGVSGWMFLLVPAYLGSPGQKAVKQFCVCVCVVFAIGQNHLIWHLCEKNFHYGNDRLCNVCYLIAVWQQPYVNIFKHFQVHTWKKSSKEGDVSAVMVRVKLPYFAILYFLHYRLYTVSQKKQDTKIWPITTPNNNRFSNFFHRWTRW